MYILVSNLDRSSTEDDLFDLFDEFGEVESVTCHTSMKVDSKVAIVVMDDDFEAQEAINELNGEWFDGKVIRVSQSASKDHIDLKWEEVPEEDDDEEDEKINKKGKSGNWEPIRRSRPGRED